MKLKTTILLAIFFTTFNGYASEHSKQPANGKPEKCKHIPYGAISTPDTVFCRTGYAVGYGV